MSVPTEQSDPAEQSGPTDQSGPAVTAPRPSATTRRRRTTASAMLLATLAIAALVILQILLVPRPTSVPRQSIDLASAALAAQSRVGFAPAVAVPQGWTVTSADVRTDSGGLPTWTVNYLTDTRRYVGLMQAPGWDATWQSSLTQGGVPDGEVTAGGRSWQVLVKQEKEITSLMAREDDRTTLILAKAGGVADARELADRLAVSP